MRKKKLLELIKGVPYSCYNFDFYRDRSRRPFQNALIALVFLIIFLSLIFSTYTTVQTVRLIERVLPEIQETFPTVYFEDGKGSTHVSQPYFIRLENPEISREEEFETFLIIDTKGEITSLKRTDARLLLTATTLEMRVSDLETVTLDLSKLKKFTLDAEWLGKMGFLIELFAFPFSFLVFFALYGVTISIQVAILYIISRIVNLRNPRKILPAGLLNISVYAVYPAAILDTLLNLWKPQRHILWMFAYVIIVLFFTIQGTQYAGKTGTEPPAEGAGNDRETFGP